MKATHPIKSYKQAVDHLQQLGWFVAEPRLENTLKLARLAGNPQDSLRFIHVAGTNGKGSTCAILESIYRAAGLRVGLYTSPHLVTFRERIQADNQLISEAKVLELVNQLVPWLNEFSQDDHPTFFEAATVMSLLYFAEQKCELVIWETGFGGRLDATNIVKPLASVITNIAFDHEQWLGETLGKIAAEKAGIIKPGIPVITATDAPEALEVIEQTARQRNSQLTLVTPDCASRMAHPVPLLGSHQKINAAAALATVEILRQKIPVSEDAIRKGMASVSWPGRFQIIQKIPGQKIVLDGAHNTAGASALRTALEREFPGMRPVIIFGALADKKWAAICAVLATMAAKVFTVPVASERTASANELARVFSDANPEISIQAAANLDSALSNCKSEPLVVITGSLYLVGEALQLLGLSPGNTNEQVLNDWTKPKNPR